MKKYLKVVPIMAAILFSACGGGSSGSDNPVEPVIPSNAGVLDTSFGNGGMVSDHNASGGDSADVGEGITLDALGNIFVTGNSQASNGDVEMVLWKYTPSGELDTSFGNHGFVTHHGPAGGGRFVFGRDVKLDTNGNIYVVGNMMHHDTTYDLVVWKYDATGALDTNFGENGTILYNSPVNALDGGFALVLDSLDNLYVTGYTENSDGNYDMLLMKYNSVGSLDSSFGNNGIVVNHNAAGGNGNDGAQGITLDNNNNIYISGVSENADTGMDIAIWKYKSDGSPDTSFGNNGVALFDGNSGGYDLAFDTAVNQEGSLYVTGGVEDYQGDYNMVVLKLHANGRIDDSFGEGGIVIDRDWELTDNNNVGISLELDSHGNVYVGGGYDNSMALWKYDADGLADADFGDNGRILIEINGASDGYGMQIDASNQLFITGWSRNTDGDADMSLWKFK